LETLHNKYFDWAKNKLFDGLNEDHLSLISEYVYELSFKENETIMKEGEEGSFVFFMTKGTARVSKGELELSKIYPGDLVGLMSLIDQQPRSADVIAGASGAKGFALKADDWEKLMSKNQPELKSIILSNYLKYQQTAFRNTNQLGLKEARSRLKLEKQRVISAHFFAQMVVGLISFIFLLGFVTDVFKQTESTFVSFGLLFAYSIWSFLFIKHSKIPVEEFGITLENFKPAIKLIGPATIIFVISLFLLKWILISFWPESFGDKLIDFYLLDEHTWSYALLVLTVYSCHAVLQEFIARSCIQGGLMQFVVGKWAEWKAIILATLMFGSFHIMIDVRYGFLTLIPGFFWGYFFYRQKNLLAISISHIIIGITALFLLNLMD